MIILLGCHCKHEYQDKKYGRGIRVCNLKTGGESAVMLANCTVCGALKHTGRKAEKKGGASKKGGGGGGKQRFVYESAESVRARFNKNRSFSEKI